MVGLAPCVYREGGRHITDEMCLAAVRGWCGYPVDADLSPYQQSEETKAAWRRAITAALALTPAPGEREGLEDWIERSFSGHGIAHRRKEEAPWPGEPFMSMAVAKDLTRQAVAHFSPGERKGETLREAQAESEGPIRLIQSLEARAQAPESGKGEDDMHGAVLTPETDQVASDSASLTAKRARPLPAAAASGDYVVVPRKVLEREEKYLHKMMNSEADIMHGDIEGAFHRILSAAAPSSPAPGWREAIEQAAKVAEDFASEYAEFPANTSQARPAALKIARRIRALAPPAAPQGREDGR
jgi:hypothetical protein